MSVPARDPPTDATPRAGRGSGGVAPEPASGSDAENATTASPSDREPTTAPSTHRTRTLLVGCSFAGLEFLYRTVRHRGRFAPGEMTVIEPRASHPYIPLTHEGASGAQPADALRFDTPAFCRALGAEWIDAAATAIDLSRRVVAVHGGREVPYDRLIIAVGSVPDVPTQFAAVTGITPAKFLDDALALRRRLHVLRVGGSQTLRVVVVGAGITGVEWSAELAGARVDGARVAMTLIGAEVRLLPHFSLPVSKRAARMLSRLGVEVLTHQRVTGVTRDHLVLGGNTSVPYDVIVWAGGVRPNPLVATLDVPLTAHGHLAVTPRLAVPGHDGVYAIGDCVRIVDAGREWPTMERAIEAIWQGAYLARRLAAGWSAESGPPHRLRRDFLYGLSLGPRQSAIVYKRLCVEGRTFVWVRRWIQRAYYARFKILAWRVGRR